MNWFKRVLGGGGTTIDSARPHPKPTHRTYVGGNWDAIGKLQFDFLISQGLRPDHYCLDIACGSLRAGRLLIEYLEPGHYLGVDKEQWLIDAGKSQELSPELLEQKQPRFVVSASFEFERFGVAPDVAWAQSLFTHLTPEMIRLCLRNLRQCIAPQGVFYATIFESRRPQVNLPESDDKAGFKYTAQEMQQFGDETGWQMRYIGRWRHPRGQRMLEYRPRA